MPYRTRVFIDFWNFSLQWRDRAEVRNHWRKQVPSVLLQEGEKQLWAVGVKDGLDHEETLVDAFLRARMRPGRNSELARLSWTNSQFPSQDTPEES